MVIGEDGFDQGGADWSLGDCVTSLEYFRQVFVNLKRRCRLGDSEAVTRCNALDRAQTVTGLVFLASRVA